MNWYVFKILTKTVLHFLHSTYYLRNGQEIVDIQFDLTSFIVLKMEHEDFII